MVWAATIFWSGAMATTTALGRIGLPMNLRISGFGRWAMGYSTSPGKWFFNGVYRHADRDIGHSLPLPDRAAQVLNGMRLDDVGKRSLIFCLPQFGRIARQTDPACLRRQRRLCLQLVRGDTVVLMFLAMPHAGPDLAKVINRIGALLRANPRSMV